MLNPNEQIALLFEKIKEKENSQDKLDLWLVKHWTKAINILKEQIK